MPYSNYHNLTKADYENLPPLVPEGKDREEILDDVVNGWTQAVNEGTPAPIMSVESLARHAVTLTRFDLRDDNPGAEPIDLGELIRRVAEKAGEPNAALRIVMVGCRVRKCRVIGVRNIPELYLFACLFSDGVWFEAGKFSDSAAFTKSTFSGKATFRRSTFQHWAFFSGVTFGCGADFTSSTFHNWADFRSSTFSGHAHFAGSTFSGHGDFGGSAFSGDANFARSEFRDAAFFDSSRFSSVVSFESSTFQTWPWLFGADFRAAQVSNIGPIVEARSWPSRVLAWMFERLDWNWVRGVGRLQALTRASYWALLIVPILAGVWHAVRERINQDNDGGAGAELAATMPLTWFLAFAAALAVAVGHFIYQIRDPQLVQESTAEDLTERAEEITRQDGGISDERMRAAIDALQNAADMLPHERSAWFVKRGKRWVWLPHELKLYRDLDDSAGEGGAWRPGPSTDRRESAALASEPDQPKQEVSAADRKRILI